MYSLKLMFNDNTNINCDISMSGFNVTEIYYSDSLTQSDNSVKLLVPYTTQLASKLLETADSNTTQAFLTDNDNPVFTGYVRKTLGLSKTQRPKFISLELVSPSFLLKTKATEDIALTNNPTIADCVNALLSAAGFDDRVTGPTDTISVFYVASGTKYSETLDSLLLSYSYTWDFDESGNFAIYPIFNQPESAITQNFDGTNIQGTLKIDHKALEYDGVQVNWKNVKEIENATIFKDTTNQADGYDCQIEIASDDYLGDNGEDGYYAQYDSDEGDIIYISSAHLDTKYDSDGIVESLTNYPTQGLVKIHNTNSKSINITQMHIIGSGYVDCGTCESKTTDGSNLNPIDANFCYIKETAALLAQNYSNWQKYSTITIDLTSYQNFKKGSFCTVSDNWVGRFIGRITQKEWNEPKSDTLYSYHIEAIASYDPSSIKSSVKKNSSGQGIQGEKGDNAPNLKTQYSVNGNSSWHDDFTASDKYMHTSNDNGNTWSTVMKIVGEDGTDGKYTNYEFAKSTSLTVAPTTGWQDAPYVISNGEYNWMRKGEVIPPQTEPNSWSTPTRMTGDKGSTGNDGISVISIDYHYAVSTSNVTVPTTWYDEPPTKASNQYLWLYTTTYYSSGSYYDTPKTVISGIDGVDGKPAYGVTLTTPNGSVITDNGRGILSASSLPVVANLSNFTNVGSWTVNGVARSESSTNTIIVTYADLVDTGSASITAVCGTYSATIGITLIIETPVSQYLGAVTETPTEYNDNEHLINNDFFLCNETFTENDVEYKLGEIYQYSNGTWLLSNDSNKIMQAMGDFSKIAEDAGTTIASKVIAQDIITKNITAQSVYAKTGTIEQTLSSKGTYEDENGVHVPRWKLDGETGTITAENAIFGKNCTLKGTLQNDLLYTQNETSGDIITIPTKNRWYVQDVYNALSNVSVVSSSVSYDDNTLSTTSSFSVASGTINGNTISNIARITSNKTLWWASAWTNDRHAYMNKTVTLPWSGNYYLYTQQRDNGYSSIKENGSNILISWGGQTNSTTKYYTAGTKLVIDYYAESGDSECWCNIQYVASNSNCIAVYDSISKKLIELPNSSHYTQSEYDLYVSSPNSVHSSSYVKYISGKDIFNSCSTLTNGITSETIDSYSNTLKIDSTNRVIRKILKQNDNLLFYYSGTDYFTVNYNNYYILSGSIQLISIPKGLITDNIYPMVEYNSSRAEGNDIGAETNPFRAVYANNLLGQNQTWQDVKKNREKEVIYYNTTGRPIIVDVNANDCKTLYLWVDNIAASRDYDGTNNVEAHVSAIVPAGSNYHINLQQSGTGINRWTEFR